MTNDGGALLAGTFFRTLTSSGRFSCCGVVADGVQARGCPGKHSTCVICVTFVTESRLSVLPNAANAVPTEDTLLRTGHQLQILQTKIIRGSTTYLCIPVVVVVVVVSYYSCIDDDDDDQRQFCSSVYYCVLGRFSGLSKHQSE